MEGAELILTHSRYYGRLTGRHRSKCVVIPNGIDLDAWGRSAPFVLPGHRPLKLVYLGRLDFMKGVDQLLSATVPPNVDLVFYGTTAGRYGGDVLAEASAREDIHYGGVLYGQEKTDMLWAADALICPSRHEPFGIVALEGLATRCLMLTSFAGGLAETIPATVGIDCGTHRQSISAALETFSIMPAADISQRTDAGSSVPRRFNWQDSANRLKGAYEHLLA